MKNKQFILLVFSLVFSLCSWGQSSAEVTAVEVENESQLVDGGLYIMTGFADNSYHAMGYQSVNGVFYFSSLRDGSVSTHTLVADVQPHCDILQFQKKEDGWYIKDLTAEQNDDSHCYLCYDNAEVGYLRTTYLPSGKCLATFEKESGGFHLLIDGYAVRYDDVKGRYRLCNDTKKFNPVRLYHVQNTKISLSEQIGLDCIDADIDVSLHRVFKPECYNTFIVPFDIPNYKQLFGQEAAAYIPTACKEGLIYFTEVKSDLKANTPYLIFGKINIPANHVYEIGFVKASHKSNETLTYHIPGLTCYGTYKVDKFASKRNMYIFGDNNIVKVKDKSKVKASLNAFRWLLVCDKTPKADALRFKKVATEIKSLRISRKNDDRIYTLGGLYMGSSIQYLPKGIYIRNGKKIVVR